MTACKKCKWRRNLMLADYCVSAEDDKFDYLSGEMKKESDFMGLRFTDKAVLCKEKNKGECPDFTPIRKEGDDA